MGTSEPDLRCDGDGKVDCEEKIAAKAGDIQEVGLLETTCLEGALVLWNGKVAGGCHV